MSTRSKGTSSSLVVELQYASPAVEFAIKKLASSAVLRKWVKTSTSLGGIITLRFVNTVEGKKLNLAFRQKDYATNVLTFPYDLTKNNLTADIILCLPIIQKEAKEQGKLLKDHLAHLIVHGCLHAQAYDHESVRDAKKMESLEIQILEKLGFNNPY